MKITVVGASGFIGRHLVAALRSRGDHVVTASLRDPASAARAAAGSAVVVNLAGEPVAQRWSPSVKEAIRTSRTASVRPFVDALGALPEPPKAYVSASAIGYYGTSEDATFEESSGPGGGFLADVCVGWEAEADRAATHGMSVTKMRTGLVLGNDGGALAKLLPIFRLGGGGIVASGKQWYSWIHIDDQVGLYLHAIDGTSGVLNGTAPNPVRNSDFTFALGHALHRPTVLPVPKFALQLILGEGAEVVASGQRVMPVRSLSTGYRFRYDRVEDALAAIAAL
jgi:uncharacterized protein (TIGR01777 family)